MSAMGTIKDSYSMSALFFPILRLLLPGRTLALPLTTPPSPSPPSVTPPVLGPCIDFVL